MDLSYAVLPSCPLTLILFLLGYQMSLYQDSEKDFIKGRANISENHNNYVQ